MGGRLALWYHTYGFLWTAKNIQTNNLISENILSFHQFNRPPVSSWTVNCFDVYGPNYFVDVSMQTGHQATALDVMAQCSEVREAAITGLYHWLLQQARHPDTVSSHVPRAMAYLEDRPQLFKLVSNFLLTASKLVSNFLLTAKFLHSFLWNIQKTHLNSR